MNFIGKKEIPSCRCLLALFACFMGRLITNGSIFCFGVYYESIRAFFGKDHFQTSFLFSLAAGTLQGTGLIVSFLLRKLSERQIVIAGGLLAGFAIFIGRFCTEFYQFIISMGFLNGFGQGLVYVTVPVAGSYIFKENLHHIAMSLQNVGDGVGFFIFPILYETLIKIFSWRNSLLIVSGVVLNICVFGALLKIPEMRKNKAKMIESARTTRTTSSESAHATLPHSLCHLWTDMAFILLLLCAFCHAIGFGLFITFVFSHMTSLGIPDQSSAWIMTLFGVSSIFSRLFTSFLDNRPYLRRWSIFAFAHLIEGLSMVAFALIGSANYLWAHVIFMCLIGFGSGFIGALVCCVMLDVLGPEKLEDSFSFMMAFWGIGSFVGAPLGGLIRDIAQSYATPLAIGGLIDAAGCILLLPLLCKQKYYQLRVPIEQKNHEFLDRCSVTSDESQEQEDFGKIKKKRLHLKGCDPVKGSLIELYGGPEITE